LEYFHVPLAYQIQQIIYKTMGVSILVSIFQHDSIHTEKQVWGHLTSKSDDKRLDIFIKPNLIVNTMFSWFYYVHYVWPLYVAASSKFAPGVAKKSLTAANGHKYCVNIIMDDKMLQYCHVFMLPTFKAYTCQRFVCVCVCVVCYLSRKWSTMARICTNGGE